MSTKKEKEEIMSYLLDNESAFGILITIMLYGSQNLLSLSKWLQKKTNSLIYHVQKLHELKLLEIDDQKKHLPGKYYKPTTLATDIMNNDLSLFFEDRQNEITQYLGNKEANVENLPEISKLFTGIMNFTKIMSTLWLVNLEPEKLTIKNGKFNKEGKQIGSSLLYVNMINVEDQEVDKRILEASRRYFEEIDTIYKEVQEKNKSTSTNQKATDDLFSNSKKFRLLYNFSALFDRS